MYIVPNTLKNFPCPNFQVLKKLRFFIYIFFGGGGVSRREVPLRRGVCKITDFWSKFWFNLDFFSSLFAASLK